MKSNRRAFVLGTPLGALVFFDQLIGPASLASAATRTAAAADPAALDFWINGMGLSPTAIPSAPSGSTGQKSGRQAGPGGDFSREPIFLHYDEKEQALVTSDQIDRKALLDSGDAEVDFQLQRLRLNSQDERHFARYASGGIYLEMAQQAKSGTPAQEAVKASSGLNDEIIQFASSIFGAFFPGSGKKPSGGKASSNSTPAGKNSKSFLPESGSSANSETKAGTAIPLQTPRQAQSLPLPNGFGRVAFCAFAKDPRRSAFGQFVAALTSSAGDPTSYTQLLSLPLMATGALTAIRAVVANLQLQGGNQEVLMQSPPMDIAATAMALSASNDPLPIRKGMYIAVPREHGPLLKPELKKYKIMNGFLVPKDATDLDVTPDLVASVLPGVTYLSLGIGVKRIRINPSGLPAA